jgi:hypothetical protein
MFSMQDMKNVVLVGAKTGKGLYDYSGKKREEILQRRDLNYIEILKAIKNSIPL